jgi:hypothetical protein
MIVGIPKREGASMFRPGDRVRHSPSGMEGRVVGWFGDTVDVKDDADSGTWRCLPRLLEPIEPPPLARELVELAAEPSPEPTPHVAEVASGAATWQQRDAPRREVLVHCRGHVVTVTASLTPADDAFTARFLGPLSREAVATALDLTCTNRGRRPLEFGVSRIPTED